MRNPQYACVPPSDQEAVASSTFSILVKSHFQHESFAIYSLSDMID
jgi:hypothetical protein